LNHITTSKGTKAMNAATARLNEEFRLKAAARSGHLPPEDRRLSAERTARAGVELAASAQESEAARRRTVSASAGTLNTVRATSGSDLSKAANAIRELAKELTGNSDDVALIAGMLAEGKTPEQIRKQFAESKPKPVSAAHPAYVRGVHQAYGK